MIKSSEIPLPVQAGMTSSKEEYLFVHSMKIGDSVTFFFSDTKWRTKFEAVRKKIKRKGWKVVQRKFEDRMILWRKD